MGKCLVKVFYGFFCIFTGVFGWIDQFIGRFEMGVLAVNMWDCGEIIGNKKYC